MLLLLLVLLEPLPSLLLFLVDLLLLLKLSQPLLLLLDLLLYLQRGEVLAGHGGVALDNVQEVQGIWVRHNLDNDDGSGSQ